MGRSAFVEKAGKVGKRMVEAAKGINPEITTDVVKKAPFLTSWEKVGSIVLFYTLYMMAATLLLALHLVVL